MRGSKAHVAELIDALPVFDDLPGAGKPLDLPEKHDPDWWVKRLIEREKITGLAPAAIGLRNLTMSTLPGAVAGDLAGTSA